MYFGAAPKNNIILPHTCTQTQINAQAKERIRKRFARATFITDRGRPSHRWPAVVMCLVNIFGASVRVRLPRRSHRRTGGPLDLYIADIIQMKHAEPSVFLYLLSR